MRRLHCAGYFCAIYPIGLFAYAKQNEAQLMEWLRDGFTPLLVALYDGTSTIDGVVAEFCKSDVYDYQVWYCKHYEIEQVDVAQFLSYGMEEA